MLKSLFVGALIALGSSVYAAADCADALQTSASKDQVKTSMASTLTIKEGQERAHIAVKGMMCGSCAGNIESAVKSLKGVDQIAVDLKAGAVEVSYDPKAVNAEAIVNQINAAKGGKYKASLAAPAAAKPQG
jgi:copper chaperone